MENVLSGLGAWMDEPPITDEIYSVERLEQLATALGGEHQTTGKRDRGSKLLPRFEENGRRLQAAYRVLAASTSGISPAAEWLIDNFHVVDEQLRQIREDLPKSYYYELPKLASGDLRGFPRIYAIAIAIISHTDSRLDREVLRRFIVAYQQVSPLTIGELWAVAITLRLALVENLRRLAMRVVGARGEREEADRLADDLLALAHADQRTAAAGLIKKLARRKIISGPFVVQLTRRLRDQGPEVTPLVEWVDAEMQRRGSRIEDVVQVEHHRQAASQLTVGNILTSMKLLSTVNWPDFFESVHLGEPILAADPAGAYSVMDFETRDRYRHVIEKVAKRTKVDELEVARRAVQMAEARRPEIEQGAVHPRQLHVGYFLIDAGLESFEKEFDYRPTLTERVRRAILRHPTGFYLGLIATLTVLIVAVLAFVAFKHGGTPALVVLTALLALIPAADLAVSLLNWDITHTFPPNVLPKMDPEDPVPIDARTMIVVPTMLSSEKVVHDLVERLEVHFLANQDPEFYFALLSDFTDASEERTPEDDGLLESAISGIERLNLRYATGAPARFFIFHRRRLWNPSENKWIAWERKRGKLEEFNRLLRGATDTTFEVIQGDVDFLRSIRYVITLDSDTQLPRNAARQLVATIRHPLNRAVFDEGLRRVVDGYGILQPRVGVTLESSGRSKFARILAGSAGIDPYGTAASDVYQDLFREGSFTGKGIYDVDAFQAALTGRVPDNALLSHDLFEGLFARSGLVTDIELFDDHPTRYDAWTKRQHRWIRGDWQIARWLFPRVPESGSRSVPNRLPLISRWKILDNLRRSVVPVSLVAWLIAAWLILPMSPLWTTIFALIVCSFPIYAPATTRMLERPKGIPWQSYIARWWDELTLNVKRVIITVTFLPHQAASAADAITRVAYRKFVSHKKLLEWMTAAQVESGTRGDRLAAFSSLYAVAGFALLAAIAIALVRPGALLLALPFLLIWAASPLIAFGLSQRTHTGQRSGLSDAERLRMRMVARSTWRFFETFVGDEDHWLPPDNFQEVPAPLIAHRTSPTNIGLLLLSTVSARDFGYLGLLEMVERIDLTLATLAKLERYEGHFLNWYDTRTLQPLNPRYVSTVDSGNLAGHLIAIKQATLELHRSRVFGAQTLDGLTDTLAHLRQESLRISVIKERSQVVTIRQLATEILRAVDLVAIFKAPEADARAWANLLSELELRARTAGDIVSVLEAEHGEGAATIFAECQSWIKLLTDQVRALRCDFDLLLPIEALAATDVARLLKERSPQLLPLWEELLHEFSSVPTVGEIGGQCELAVEAIGLMAQRLGTNREHITTVEKLNSAAALIERTGYAASGLLERGQEAARNCDRLIETMNFRFLFDEDRKLFVIGYNVSDGRRDHSYYDLLASEARLGSLMAIAYGEVPQEHWFKLGRQFTQGEGGGRVLISWAGTMFEYLMPILVTEDYDETLLHQTYSAVLRRQIAYGREHGVPWGVSESAFHARDLQLNYQYGPFGVPGLGIKRGLSEELVIAPYATCLAAMVDPRAAVENMERLEQGGALSRYGFFEAIDYTPDRLPQGSRRVVIHSFMTHHQGMSLVALGNVLHGGAMRRRFHNDPRIQATELLLQERVPQNAPVGSVRTEELAQGRLVNTLTEPAAVAYDSASLPTPRTQLISNGRYAVMVTSAGAGSSTCLVPGSQPMAVTRWREDVARDNWGAFCYLRDVKSGAIWSSGYQPTARRPQSYEVSFTEERAVFRRMDWGILTQTDIVVSPEDDAEVRCVSVTNRSGRVREIELTSYSEIVLATAAADTAHPAFSSLFVETEFVAAESSLIARRRQRSPEEPTVFACHTITTEGDAIGLVQYETSRQRFLGRGHDTRLPLALLEDRPLSNTVGTVLDPVFSLRQRIRLQPNETARITFSTAVAYSRDHILMLADKYHDPSIFERVERLAWTHAHVQMRHLNIEPREAHLFQRLAGRVLYCDSSLRAKSDVLSHNFKTQQELWKYGIGGDLPIVLIRVKVGADVEMLRQMLRAHEYLRLKGLQMDLVVLNDDATSYLQLLQDEIQMLVRSAGLQGLLDKTGGIHLRRADIIPDDDKVLLYSVARVVLSTDRGTLEEQLVRRPVEDKEQATAFVARAPERGQSEQLTEGGSALQHFNGLGGFARGGREYVTILNEGQWTPAPWTNVIANNLDFGFQVSESGSGYTWSVNSRENRLTPWSNDAVGDAGGEILYLRDEDTGAIWTPTPLPIREAQSYVVRHGHGYSTFEHLSHGIEQELTVFVPMDATVKISRLRLKNRTDRRRRISVTAFHELVLGVVRERSAPFVVTDVDEKHQAVFARNSYNNEFADRTPFVAMSPTPTSLTCDRKAFLGRNGTPAQPAALSRMKLDNRFGPGLDPCAALQTVVDLAPGESHDLIVLLGDSGSREEGLALIDRFLDPKRVETALDEAVNYWHRTLSSVEVRTPNPAMDLMLNGWLLYQTLACRIWARSAFYQSGGAYGFRDQLQDVMALVYSHPEIARAQIIRAASRQFREGDVQHWWHPPSGRGVRTRISDDLLWLPYVVEFYSRVTGDMTILDEEVPFIEGPLLEEHQHETYNLPQVSAERASVYEHCLRAIRHSLRTGEHGLPLMGSGDWNDGMNRVGHLGKGESIWLAWFLCATLEAFARVGAERGDKDASKQFTDHAESVRAAVEKNAWDGDWYLRAYFDDGSKLGSAENDECRIDSIAQSWAVISGVGDRRRAAHAMVAVEEHLVRPGDGLVLLFDPPFDHGARDPGYIKGYVPGVRENGGQYTHAALWTMIAFAELGDGDRAAELFELLNPINHSSTRAGLHKYKVEPYVAAADVYAIPPHTGRGGWTWYTGSAGWMYRAGLESLLGFRLEGASLRIDPCIPRGWREFEITYRPGKPLHLGDAGDEAESDRESVYVIRVENPYGVSRGVGRVEIDGVPSSDGTIEISRDGREHHVRIILGADDKVSSAHKDRAANLA